MSALHRGARFLVGRLPARGEDRGSLALAMMAILVGVMLGALIVPTLVAQDRSTRFDISRIHSLHEAQTGVDVLLGQIRASTTTDNNGVTFGNNAKLPCWSQANPMTGNANATGLGAYSAYVTYWAANPSAGGSPMLCSAGYGTYDSATQTATPHYAIIHSTGTDGPARDGGSKGRTIVTTYVFQRDDTNISGGLIKIYPDSSGNLWCMDGGSAVPATGTQVVLRACSGSTPPVAQQVFAYRSDLSIQLVSSVTPSLPYGLCLDTSPTAHASSGVSIVLKTCAVINPAKCASVTACSPWYQQWSVDDVAHLEGAKTDQSDVDSFCINAAAQVDGTALTLASCAGSVTDTAQTWVLSPTTGAGMAGASNNQLVNYKQFATCLDVTQKDPNAAYLILYNCKQNPAPTNVAWNQKFAPSPALTAAPSQVSLRTTTTGGTTYCLTSPATSSATVGGYVTVTTPCPNGAATTWTVYQTQDASGNDLPYAQKYEITDSYGNCLAPGPNSDLYIAQYLKVIVSKCDGSTGQKWNANASLDAAKLTGTHETP